MNQRPLVFISYSWDVGDVVLELAERLVGTGGVDVILDKWDLKPGQDKYFFMEQAVNNTDVTNVLIICDKTYMEKANGRVGGVGDETVIISKEVYENVQQEKFVPVIIEVDENKKPYMPTYMNTRVYIKLNEVETYDKEYEKLLRILHQRPLLRKPKLSEPPVWLNEENVSLTAIRDLLKELKPIRQNDDVRIDYLVRHLSDTFSTTLTEFALPYNEKVSGEYILKQIEATKPLRDYFVDFVELLISKEVSVGIVLAEHFEKMHNNTVNSLGNISGSFYPDNLEVNNYFLWETFICSVALLLHFERYKQINALLNHTYFLMTRGYGETPCDFTTFNYQFPLIEDVCKPISKEPRLISLAARIATEREKKPLLTEKSIAHADLVLYQLSTAFKSGKVFGWFPKLYVYYPEYGRQSLWIKLQSKSHCEKVFPLFGVETICELKNCISRCVQNDQYAYSSLSYRGGVPNILSNLELVKIGSLN